MKSPHFKKETTKKILINQIQIIRSHKADLSGILYTSMIDLNINYVNTIQVKHLPDTYI